MSVTRKRDKGEADCFRVSCCEMRNLSTHTAHSREGGNPANLVRQAQADGVVLGPRLRGDERSKGRRRPVTTSAGAIRIQISNSHARLSSRRALRRAGEKRGGRRADRRRPVLNAAARCRQVYAVCANDLLRRSRLSAHRPTAFCVRGSSQDRTILGPRLRACANRAQAVQRAPRAPVVVPVGRGPEAPRCLRARQTAGAAPRSAQTTPRESAPR
jgi:hypothetical protein